MGSSSAQGWQTEQRPHHHSSQPRGTQRVGEALFQRAEARQRFVKVKEGEEELSCLAQCLQKLAQGEHPQVLHGAVCRSPFIAGWSLFRRGAMRRWLQPHLHHTTSWESNMWHTTAQKYTREDGELTPSALSRAAATDHTAPRDALTETILSTQSQSS